MLLYISLLRYELLWNELFMNYIQIISDEFFISSKSFEITNLLLRN
jgi:hypothetical protein